MLVDLLILKDFDISVLQTEINPDLLEEEDRLKQLHLKTLYNYYKNNYTTYKNFDKDFLHLIFKKHRNLLDEFEKNKNYLLKLYEDNKLT